MSAWGRRGRTRSEGGTTPRTWYRKESDGTFFRNCPLIMAEREQALEACNLRATARLADEWDECFREGVITASEIAPGDRWIEYDDSPEANERWVGQILAGRTRRGETP